MGSRKNGKEWFNFLKKIGKNVGCFFDMNASIVKYDCEIKVKIPESCTVDKTILLISPDKHTDEIAVSARQFGYKNIVFGNILKFIPRYGELETDMEFPYFGHFYSLYPDFYDVDTRYDEVLALSESRDETDGIRMNVQGQCSVLQRMNGLYESFPKWERYDATAPSKLRYRIGNPSIGLSDSLVLHFMVRLLKPKHYVEVGSGYSSAVVLDTNEFYLENRMDIKFIEPYPELVYSLLKEMDNAEDLVLPSKLQDVPIEFFERLGENDVLFIDSTHVSKEALIKSSQKQRE